MFTSTITAFILVPVFFFDPMKKRALQTGAGIPTGSTSAIAILQQLEGFPGCQAAVFFSLRADTDRIPISFVDGGHPARGKGPTPSFVPLTSVGAKHKVRAKQKRINHVSRHEFVNIAVTRNLVPPR
jgi:hypothetical protein